MRALAVVGVLGMVLWAAPASAQLYKWVDERGVTHYSEKPPANKGGAPVQLRDATGGARSGSTASSSGSNLQDQEREFQRRQRDRNEANEERQREQQRQAGRGSSSDCVQARRDLHVMENTSTYYSFDQLSQARNRVASACR